MKCDMCAAFFDKNAAEGSGKLSEEELYEAAAKAYNAGEYETARSFLKRLLPLKKAKYFFLAGLNEYMHGDRRRHAEMILRWLEKSRCAGGDLRERDFVKRAEMLKEVYWEVGDAAKCCFHALEACELAQDADKKRLNLSAGLLASNALENLSAEEIFQLHTSYGDFIDAQSLPPEEPKVHRKPRIGYISPDFRQHAVARFLEAFTVSHTRAVRVYCYSKVKRPDGVTEKIKNSVDVWRDIGNLTARQAAERIRADEIDILVELAGHTADNGLEILAWRPAPVQICGIGYINTTGMRCVDYFITDRYCTTEEQAAFFTERPLYLPKTHVCYTPPKDAPPCRHEKKTAARPVLFGCFNKANKISDAILWCWKRILAAVPGSRLLLKNGAYDFAYGRKRMEKRLQAMDFPLDRVLLEGASKDYLERYNEVDVALDTYPCGGVTTTFDALVMGVPVITLVGRCHAARLGYSILKNLDQDEWIAFDEDEYVKKAAALALDEKKLAFWHENLRQTLEKSSLLNVAAYAEAVEQSYMELYYGLLAADMRLRLFAYFLQLGNEKIRSQAHQDAFDCARVLLAIDKKNKAARQMYAGCCMHMGRIKEAVAAAKKLLDEDGGDVEASLVLAYCYRKEGLYHREKDVLLKARQVLAKGGFHHGKSGEILSLLACAHVMLGEAEQAVPLFLESSRVEKDRKKAIEEYSNACFSANYSAKFSQAELQRLHSGYNAFFSSVQRFSHAFRYRAKIRVGYVSADFRRHPVAYYALAFVEAYDKNAFEVYCYQAGGENDEITERFRKASSAWRDIRALTDEEAARLVSADEIDLLVDLSGHTKGNRLGVFAYRPAPVQISGIGYFHSTGLREMDYFLTDTTCDPVENRTYFSEKLLYLEHSHWCYRPLGALPEIVEVPCVKNGYITFGSFNNFSKVTEEQLSLWRRILERVPGSRLLLKSRLFDAKEEKKLAKGRLGRLGFSPERVELRGFTECYLEEYGDMDIALDTFPYQGGATTCEALSMGVPVVTLVGRRHGSRFGLSILQNAGCGEFITESRDAYVEKAAALAARPDVLRVLRRTLREKIERSPLMNVKQYMMELEGAYKAVWQSWVRAGGQEGKDGMKKGKNASIKNLKRLLDDRFNGSLSETDFQNSVQAMGKDEQAQLLRLLDERLLKEKRRAWAIFAEAEKLYAKRKYRESMAKAEAGLALDGGSARGWILRGKIAEALKDGAKLDESLRRATALGEFHELPPSVQSVVWGSYGNLCGNTNRLGDLLAIEERMVGIAEDLPEKRLRYSNYLYVLQIAAPYGPREMLEKNLRYNDFFPEVVPFSHTGRKRAGRKIRIGYLSVDYHQHPVAFFFMKLLYFHDKERVEVYCYSGVEEKDKDKATRQIEHLCDVWRDIAQLPAREAADLIYRDQIDILVDLGGHTAHNLLSVAAWRPAPVQISGIGYIGTTGLRTMDYFLTDRYCDLPEGEQDFSEKLLRLPHSHFCYAMRDDVKQLRPAPVSTKGYVTFGSFNRVEKITDRMLFLWGEILRRVPRSRLFLKSSFAENEYYVSVMRRRLQAAGIEFARVDLQGATANYMDAYFDVDIALDTFPCCGGTTTCDALVMGVPVITLVGRRHVSRFGYSIMKNARLEEFIAYDEAQYVERAAALAKNQELLNSHHLTLRERLKQSPVMDGALYARELEDAYEKIVERGGGGRC